MAKCEKLLEKAKNSPYGLRFEELCALAECYGWMFKRQRGTSHQVWENPNLTPEQGRRKTFQPISGKAAGYQVNG
ncbi:MAG: type II toxin-antitoxin system HicA family toxin [Pyrinomonadaceae bacterium]|nr:type II toxin-antitoxin system HicA family toxin [Pyrinomonadaceae bacterium]